MKERIIKTVVPFVVGWLVSLLATINVTIPEEIAADVANALTLVFGAVYYVVVVLLAKRWPSLEVLLGSKKKPEYEG